MVSYPSGRLAIRSWIRAARAASSISSSEASGFAKRRFSLIEAWKRYVSCETTPIVRATDDSVLRARRDLEADVLQRPFRPGLIAEPDILEGQIAAAGRQVDSILALDDVHGQVEVFED